MNNTNKEDISEEQNPLFLKLRKLISLIVNYRNNF